VTFDHNLPTANAIEGQSKALKLRIFA